MPLSPLWAIAMPRVESPDPGEPPRILVRAPAPRNPEPGTGARKCLLVRAFIGYTGTGYRVSPWRPVMLTSAITLALLLCAAGDDMTEERKPHPLAPSLPMLTPEEEKKIDDIIDRFILYDTGQLTGEAGRKALREFEALGPDATI